MYCILYSYKRKDFEYSNLKANLRKLICLPWFEDYAVYICVEVSHLFYISSSIRSYIHPCPYIFYNNDESYDFFLDIRLNFHPSDHVVFIYCFLLFVKVFFLPKSFVFDVSSIARCLSCLALESLVTGFREFRQGWSLFPSFWNNLDKVLLSIFSGPRIYIRL